MTIRGGENVGSDLASLRTRAVRDGDGWRITGQKVWSSGAHHADVGEVLTRTEDDPSLRHAGLTMFLVDMRDPGVTVKPLRQMNGNAHFNEVFLQDVFVPAEAMLGPRGGGWDVANASLTSERDIPIDGLGLFLDPFGRYIEMARELGLDGDARHRQRIAGGTDEIQHNSSVSVASGCRASRSRHRKDQRHDDRRGVSRLAP